MVLAGQGMKVEGRDGWGDGDERNRSGEGDSMGRGEVVHWEDRRGVGRNALVRVRSVVWVGEMQLNKRMGGVMEMNVTIRGWQYR